MRFTDNKKKVVSFCDFLLLLRPPIRFVELENCVVLQLKGPYECLLYPMFLLF